MIEQNRNNLASVLSGYGGDYTFCQNCLNERCRNSEDKNSKPKILKINEYVIGFIYDFVDNNLPAYPNPGGYDKQPFWFISLFHAGVNKLREVRRENERKA